MEISANSKYIKKNKYPVDLEAEKKFDELKRKYANAIAYLLASNITRAGLAAYFSANDDNKRRFATVKKLRAQIVEVRPKARLWVDKPFYTKIELGTQVINGEGHTTVPIILGECVFSKVTEVVVDKQGLERYMETIAKIIDAERVWADPEMADFDLGERDYLTPDPVKTVVKKDDDTLV